MRYIVTSTSLPESLLLQPKVLRDERGFFFESFNARDFESATNLKREFRQDNHSCSVKGTLRGLHYQIEHPQGKLVRVTRGEIFDVAVDLRRSSPNFGKWAGVVLSAENNLQLWIPEGFAHGFQVLTEYAEFLYKVTDYWYPQHERVIIWNDPTLAINWPLSAPLLATKDAKGKCVAEAETFA